MSDKTPTKAECEENNVDCNMSLDQSIHYAELSYGELEESLGAPIFELSSPISSISSNCSSPDRTVQREYVINEDAGMDDSDDFVSLEELHSQISPPMDTDSSAATLMQRSNLETIYEGIYLETPPGTPGTSAANSSARKRRLLRTDLSKCEEFKENLQQN
jgi:hypothetical protein